MRHGMIGLILWLSGYLFAPFEEGYSFYDKISLYGGGNVPAETETNWGKGYRLRIGSNSSQALLPIMCYL